MPSTPNVSAYPWCQPQDITEVDDTQFNQPLLAKCIQAATDVLFQLSGRQYAGAATDVVRPQPRVVRRDHGRPVATAAVWSTPGGVGYYSGGYMAGFGYSRYGWVTTNREELADGTTLPSVDLGAFPVTGITQVKVDGSTVDPTAYRVDDWRHLVRVVNPALDPSGSHNPGWPTVQRMDLPSTEPGTFEVSLAYGVLPPRAGIMACAELAYQLYLASTPALAGQARLPQRVTQITRQGVTAVVLDPLAFLENGRTGLTRCDYFLRAVNPKGLQRRATATNVDVKRRVRRTGPVGG